MCIRDINALAIRRTATCQKRSSPSSHLSPAAHRSSAAARSSHRDSRPIRAKVSHHFRRTRSSSRRMPSHPVCRRIRFICHRRRGTSDRHPARRHRTRGADASHRSAAAGSPVAPHRHSTGGDCAGRADASDLSAALSQPWSAALPTHHPMVPPPSGGERRVPITAYRPTRIMACQCRLTRSAAAARSCRPNWPIRSSSRCIGRARVGGEGL